MLSPATAGLSPEVLVSSKGEVSPTACILANVQRLLLDTDTTIEDVSLLLKLDPALSARVMHIGNSVEFSRGAVSSSIEESLGRVGFREIQRLVALAASRSMVAKVLDSYGLSAEQAWHEAVGSAIGSYLIAEVLGEDPSIAYTAGLLHCMGRQAINAHLQVHDKDLILENHGFPVFYMAAEADALGFTQAPVAAALLKSMAFPGAVIDPVRQQDQGLYEEGSNGRMRYVITLSRLLYETVFSERTGALTGCGADVLAEVGMKPEQLREMEPRLREEMEMAIDLIYH